MLKTLAMLLAASVFWAGLRAAERWKPANAWISGFLAGVIALMALSLAFGW